MNDGKRNQLSVTAVFAYPNNHATSTLDRCEEIWDGISIEYFYFKGFPTFRANNQWVIPQNSSRLSIFRPWIIIRFLWKLMTADRLYFQSFSSPRLGMPLALLFARAFAKAPFICIASEGLKRPAGRVRRLLCRILFNSSKIIHLGIGAGSSDDFRGLGLSKWRFRKFCFTEPYRNRMTKGPRSGMEGKVHLLSVGQLIERKGFRQLLLSISRAENRSRIKLSIAGSGEQEQELRNLAEDLSLLEQVKFHGFCDEATLDELYSASDVFILLSDYDGWGVVVNRAVAYGLPCILSENVRSGRGHLVDNGVNGYICEGESNVVMAIDELVASEACRLIMSDESKQRAKVWDIAIVAERLGSFLFNDEIEFGEGPLEKVVFMSN